MMNIRKFSKLLLASVIVLSMTADSFAALTVPNDTYVTKEDVDKAVLDINEKLSLYENSLTEKLDAILSEYKPIGSIEVGVNPNGVYEGTWQEITDSIIVDSKNNSDSTGYRLYSDGWCEQWGANGVFGTSSTGVSITVNLLVPYTSSDYVAIVTDRTNDAAGGASTGLNEYQNNSTGDKTTTSFVAKRRGGAMQFFGWHTWGQTNVKTKVWKRTK